MLGKKLLWSLMTAMVLMNAGCCRMWDRWCDRPNSHYQGVPNYCQPVQCAPVQQPCVCPPGSAYYQPQGGVAPVPAAPGSAGWARPGCN